jgi:hypothetical protein
MPYVVAIVIQKNAVFSDSVYLIIRKCDRLTYLVKCPSGAMLTAQTILGEIRK